MCFANEPIPGELMLQVLDNAVENNEIYVLLCESVQTLEPQLQRLHSLLTNMRSLLVKLREIVSAANEAAPEGGNSKGISSSISKDFVASSKGRSRVGGKFNLEPPELAPVISVCCCNFTFIVMLLGPLLPF
jgi:hypothetical protein